MEEPAANIEQGQMPAHPRGWSKDAWWYTVKCQVLFQLLASAYESNWDHMYSVRVDLMLTNSLYMVRRRPKNRGRGRRGKMHMIVSNEVRATIVDHVINQQYQLN